MSHFAVVVFGENVDEKMEHYWELDLSQDEAKEDYRACFEDETSKIKEEFKTGTCTMCELSDGRFVPTWSDEGKKVGCTKEVPIHRLYKDWKEFAVKEYGYVVDDDRCGYYHNPNAKWDWFVIGGRWRGYFMCKQNPLYPMDIVLTKNDSLFGENDEELSEKACDIIRKCDIDIEAMQKVSVEFAEKSWKEARSNKQNRFIHNVKNGVTLREHLEDARQNTMLPYAFIDIDGEWFERDGMFGMSNEDGWRKTFMDYFNSVPDDTLLTAVDCHI